MSPHVYLIAGEPSGDVLGARLINGLKELTAGDVRISGVGGPLMEAEGLNSLYGIEKLSVMGLVEIVASVPAINRLIRRVVADIRAKRPDVVVTIDAQAFSHWVAKRLQPRTCPIVHYVAPTVWAWRPRRAKSLAKLVDRVLMLFAFEKPYFDAVGLDAVVVGHPIASHEVPADAGPRFRVDHGFGADDTVVCLLPGSRKSEIARLLPIFQTVAERLTHGRPNLRFVLPTVGHIEATVRAAVADWSVPVTILSGSEDDKHAALRASDVALAKSGTVTLELAAAGLPSVIAYRANPMTAAIVRHVVRVRHAAMVNLIEGSEVLPEFLQEWATPDNIFAAVSRLLDDEAPRRRQQDAMARVMTVLGKGGEPPHLRAARAVLEMVPRKND